MKPGGTPGSHVCSWRSVAIRFQVETLKLVLFEDFVYLPPRSTVPIGANIIDGMKAGCVGDCWRRPDGIGHPLAASDHSESITPHVGVSHPPQPHSRRGLSDMVSLGLVQGCFKMYWGLFRVGLRVGLRFLQGFLIVCFRVY